MCRMWFVVQGVSAKSLRCYRQRPTGRKLKAPGRVALGASTIPRVSWCGRSPRSIDACYDRGFKVYPFWLKRLMNDGGSFITPMSSKFPFFSHDILRCIPRSWIAHHPLHLTTLLSGFSKSGLGCENMPRPSSEKPQ